MGKKIVLRESQLKRLLQYNTKQKLKESLEDLEPVDYNMGKQGDGNLLPNPPKELNVDVEDGKFVDYTMGKEGDYYEDDSTSAEIDMETGITMEDDYSLNEGQKELKSTFNKYMGNPIIESLSSKIK